MGRKREALTNWPLLRKVETFVFAGLFLAVPLFAVRVVDHATTSLAVKNTAVDLVKDLIRSKNIAISRQASIVLSSEHLQGNKLFMITIREKGSKDVIEEVVLPVGVVMLGSITFDAQGKPTQRASFLVTRNNHTSHVDVDAQGRITTDAPASR